MKRLQPQHHVHFIGVGGIGMSGLAQLLLKRGYKVTGSDVKSSCMTQTLERLGCSVAIGHQEDNVGRADVVVYSSAIGRQNPELLTAHRRGLRVMRRAEVLSELMGERRGIAVTGAHGKTTTSSMIALILREGGRDPMAAIGGEVSNFGSNVLCGEGEFFVAEADESDGSFLELRPEIAVLTNLDVEHMDHYGSLAQLESAYRQFQRQIADGGVLIYCSDDPRLLPVCAWARGVRTISYGLQSGAMVRVGRMQPYGMGSRFEVWISGRCLGEFTIQIPGHHNVSNAAAAIAAALELGIDVPSIQRALASFTGANRRFQVRGRVDDIMVVDDYAHHPTEIEVTLGAARRLTPDGGRLLVLFQPHRFSRTANLAEQFGGCFSAADHLLLTDIYSAGEPAISGVSSRLIHDAIRRVGRPSVEYLPYQSLVPTVEQWVRSRDLVVFLGAGDITDLVSPLVERLQHRRVSCGAVGLGDTLTGSAAQAGHPAEHPETHPTDHPVKQEGSLCG